MSLLGVAGFALMILIVALLLWGKSTPAVVFILLPIIVGFAVGFSPTDMSEYIKSGVASVSTTAILFIFAVLFFGVMNDAGVFDRIVNKVLKVVGGNILLLMFATVLIAFIGHLDGSGATTLLIAIPPLLRFGLVTCHQFTVLVYPHSSDSQSFGFHCRHKRSQIQ
jgi:citrate-Mg2+:H+ or citrate-Ca2+:H+ symporter, CitMHS family